MNNEEIIELYKTQEGRFYLVTEILKQDNFSITKIVAAKEMATKEKLDENRIFISGLAFRATSMFGDKIQDVIKNIEQVKPLVAQDIIKCGVIKGTQLEKELIEQYQN